MKQSIGFSLLLALLGAFSSGCSKSDDGHSGLQSTVEFTSPEAVRASGAFGIYEDGWVETEAQVEMGNPSHYSILSIEGTNVQTKPGDEILTLAVIVGDDTVAHCRISTLGKFRELVMLPQKVSAMDSLGVRLISSKSFVPSMLGTSSDKRTLAYRLERLSIASAEQERKPFPEYFEFPSGAGENANCQGIFSDGWLTDSASIVLYNPAGKSLVEIRGLVPGNVYTGVATLEVSMDGALLVKHQVKSDFRVQFQVPEKLRAMGTVKFTLKPGSTFTPAGRGISSDTRRLSYQLRYVGLR